LATLRNDGVISLVFSHAAALTEETHSGAMRPFGRLAGSEYPAR
jgi:hypothetical protein